MILFLLKYWKYLLSGLLAGIIGYQIGYFIGNKVGFNLGYDTASVEFVIKIEEKNREINNAKISLEKEIINSSDPVLDDRLDRWMRD